MKKIIFLFLILLIGCKQPDQNTKWYEETKAEILRQSNLKADSSYTTYNKDSSFNREHFFSSGHEFHLKGCDTNKVLGLETYYSKDGSFELRREVCDNGIFCFEGIYYKSNFYGLSTWSFSNGQIDQQGVRHNGQKIGIWKKWDNEGKLLEETDHGKIEKLDSMPTITK